MKKIQLITKEELDEYLRTHTLREVLSNIDWRAELWIDNIAGETCNGTIKICENGFNTILATLDLSMINPQSNPLWTNYCSVRDAVEIVTRFSEHIKQHPDLIEILAKGCRCLWNKAPGFCNL